MSVQLAGSEEAVRWSVAATDPELVVCPFLRERVPVEVWRNRRTIIIHPGPKGDRGPSSLDWAVMRAEPVWGVTAVQAVEEMDAGPIWGTRTFPMQAAPVRKSVLYNGPVTDAAIELIHEVVAKAADPGFVPEELDYRRSDVWGRHRPIMQQADRQFCWSDPTERIVRSIRAADGWPGVRSVLCGIPVSVFDAHPGPQDLASVPPGEPGSVVLRGAGAVLVRTGDGAVWVGQLRRLQPDPGARIKLPATMVLGSRLAGIPEASDRVAHHDIQYRRVGAVGIVSFDFYNGAMSTQQCRRLCNALRRAAAADTKVLLVQGGEVFSNGIHLNVIEAARQPRLEAWRNINAINDVCREIITCTDQLVVAAVAGNAGAGGVMLALGADRVLVRDGVVLNPHYRTMGLFGSEYWTYVLPRRVGDIRAHALTQQCLPIGATEAAQIGLVDAALHATRTDFETFALEEAARLAGRNDHAHLLADKRARRAADERRRPLRDYRAAELHEMARDIFSDRNGFASARQAFVHKEPQHATPQRIAVHRRAG